MSSDYGGASTRTAAMKADKAAPKAGRRRVFGDESFRFILFSWLKVRTVQRRMRALWHGTPAPASALTWLTLRACAESGSGATQFSLLHQRPATDSQRALLESQTDGARGARRRRNSQAGDARATLTRAYGLRARVSTSAGERARLYNTTSSMPPLKGKS